MSHFPTSQPRQKDPLTMQVQSAAYDYIQRYHPNLDANRANVVPCYTPYSKLIYNGNVIADKDKFFNYDLPRTAHTTISIDCHPMYADPSDPKKGLHCLVTVLGTVMYNGVQESKRMFYQTLVLVNTNNGLQIAHETFRWIGK